MYMCRFEKKLDRDSQVNVVFFLDALSEQLALLHAEFDGIFWLFTQHLTLLVQVHENGVQRVDNTIPSQNLTWSSSSE